MWRVISSTPVRRMPAYPFSPVTEVISGSDSNVKTKMRSPTTVSISVKSAVILALLVPRLVRTAVPALVRSGSGGRRFTISMPSAVFQLPLGWRQHFRRNDEHIAHNEHLHLVRTATQGIPAQFLMIAVRTAVFSPLLATVPAILFV